jgi:Uma2 family endonuclease
LRRLVWIYWFGRKNLLRLVILNLNLMWLWFGGSLRDYAARHPRAEDIVLVVEISDSTLERDRVWKQRIYAEAKIPLYWIVNLVDHQLEIYRLLGSEQYALPQVYQLTEVAEFMLEGKVFRVTVRDLMF